MFNFFKRSILFIIGIFIVIWWLLPLIISIKRWFFGISYINIVYPFDIQLLLIYYILYIILLFILLYQLFKFYYVYNNRVNFILKFISDLLQKPWIYLENKIWSHLDIKLYKVNNFFKYILEYDFKLFGRHYSFHIIYYRLQLFIMYFNLLILVLCIYVEVLYYNQIYYTYYVLMFILIERLLGFILNRILTSLENNKKYYFEVLKLNINRQRIYTKNNMPYPFILDMLPYIRESDIYEYTLDYFYYKEDIIICDNYSVNMELMFSDKSDKDLLIIILNFYCIKNNVIISELIDLLQDEEVYFKYIEECLFYMKFYINSCNRNLSTLGVYFKNKLQKYLLIKNLIRVFSIVILITIVLYINICF